MRLRRVVAGHGDYALDFGERERQLLAAEDDKGRLAEQFVLQHHGTEDDLLEFDVVREPAVQQGGLDLLPAGVVAVRRVGWGAVSRGGAVHLASSFPSPSSTTRAPRSAGLWLIS